MVWYPWKELNHVYIYYGPFSVEEDQHIGIKMAHKDKVESIALKTGGVEW